MSKRFVAFISVLAAVALLVPAAAASPGVDRVERSYCGITWGSLDKVAGPATSPLSPLTNIRTGQHTCYDRMVFDVVGAAPGYRVHYVDQVTTVASGAVLPLTGGARIEIVLRAPASTPGGRVTYPARTGGTLPGVDLTGYRTFRSARYGGSFEGVTIVGLGVRARLPFRVFKLDHRLVVDVAHRW